jgi:hypothetical protein
MTSIAEIIQLLLPFLTWMFSIYLSHRLIEMYLSKSQENIGKVQSEYAKVLLFTIMTIGFLMAIIALTKH